MPTLLLTFANSDTHKLPTLTQEYDEVNQALRERFANGDFVVVSESFTTPEKIIDLIQSHERSITLFSYSGHAGRDRLLLEDGEGYGSGVASLLGRCTNLKLVILNGCSTAGQVKLLKEKGVPVVIATSAPVDDYTATQFAISFFKELAQRRKSIREAFERAVDAAKVRGKIEDIKVTARGLGNKKEDTLWGLYFNRGSRGILDSWRLGDMTPVTLITETGRIVNNIPSEMKQNERVICKIRIAKDEEKLLKGFDIPKGKTSKLLEISETMEVDLVDANKDVFKIELITPVRATKQSIVNHTFSQWDFAITPLKEGNQTLILYAFLVEQINGLDKRRILSFECQIKITSGSIETTNKLIVKSPMKWTVTYTNLSILLPILFIFSLISNLNYVNPYLDNNNTKTGLSAVANKAYNNEPIRSLKNPLSPYTEILLPNNKRKARRRKKKILRKNVYKYGKFEG